MDPQASDLYERIGTSREESRERLEQRAHRATAEYHRRRHRATGDARQELLSAIERIEEAASVLTDPQRRQAYDRQRQTDRTARERSTADRGSTSLRIEIEPRSPSPGETVAIRTTDTDERPVPGVDVRIEYDETEQTVTTDRDGRKRLRFTSPQEVRLTAEKGTVGGRSYESAAETMIVGDAAETEREPGDADDANRDAEAEPDRRGEKRSETTDDAANATEAPSPERETTAFEGKPTDRPGDADGSHGSSTIHLHHAAGIVGIAVVGIATAVGWATAVPLAPAAAGAGILALTLYLIAREAATAGR